MQYLALLIKVALVFGVSSITLARYGNFRRHNYLVTLVVLFAWNFSLLIVIILPLDILNTLYRQCLDRAAHDNPSTLEARNDSLAQHEEVCIKPSTWIPDETFPVLWIGLYWTIQFLTWLVMPMMQSYIKTGDFTVKGRLKSAFIDNTIYYGSYLLICGVLLIYLALKPNITLDWHHLKAIASSASNTWGLFLLVLLLGHGLVEKPRSLWKDADFASVLTRSYFKLAKINLDKIEAEETVDDLLGSLQAVSVTMGRDHSLHVYLDIILKKIPSSLREKMSTMRISDDSLCGIPNEKTLIRLHKQIIKSLFILQRTETQKKILLEEIVELEDIEKNVNSNERYFKKTHYVPRLQYFYSSIFEWYWKCVFYKYIQRCLAVVMGVMSATIVWSEVTFFNKQPVLSIFAIIITESSWGSVYKEIFCTLSILLIFYCAYSTVLKVRLFNWYYLAPHHQTNEYSLIFSGTMLSRLIPPLCLNFLGMIHMDSNIIKKQMLETHYTQIMGHMDVISIISDGFNIYFPMAILIFCLATYFKIGSKILGFLGFQQFMEDNEITLDLIEEGRELMRRERRKLEDREASRLKIGARKLSVRSSQGSRAMSAVRKSMNRTSNKDEVHLNLLEESHQLDSYNGASMPDPAEKSFYQKSQPATSPKPGVQDETTVDFNYQVDYNYRKRLGLPVVGIFDDV